MSVIRKSNKLVRKCHLEVDEQGSASGEGEEGKILNQIFGDTVSFPKGINGHDKK
jgi:hypothetical protein